MKIQLSIAAAVLAGVLFLGSGFVKRTDVVLGGYMLAEDGASITLQAGPAGSMGYIRESVTEQDGDALYVSFYTAFGGLNSSIGAKDTFTLPVDPACRVICFDRGDGEYAPVLQRDAATGEWQPVQ